MPRNLLLDEKRTHTIKVSVDDTEMNDIGWIGRDGDRSPPQVVGRFLRVGLYGRIGHRPVPRQRTNQAKWGRVTLEECGLTQRDIDAIDFLSMQTRQPNTSVLVQLIRVALHGRVLRPVEDEHGDFGDSLFGDSVYVGRGEGAA